MYAKNCVKLHSYAIFSDFFFSILWFSFSPKTNIFSFSHSGVCFYRLPIKVDLLSFLISFDGAASTLTETTFKKRDNCFSSNNSMGVTKLFTSINIGFLFYSISHCDVFIALCIQS